ncbi:Toll/interleukin-1 receptor domain-containing protein [Tanacetum coccineum]
MESLFKCFCKTYEVHHHLEAPATTTTSTDPLHESNDSLMVMWIYSTISPKLVDMIVDDSTTAHGVWKRLQNIFHDNKDARVVQLNNEIRNIVIGNLFVNDYFQELKSKADQCTNLDSPVSDSSLVTYAINGARSKFSKVSRIIRHHEKLHTFDEARSLILLEERGWLNQQQNPNVFHNTSSSPTVLVTTPDTSNKDNTMSTSGIDLCRNFQGGSCTYGGRCKFVYAGNDFRPRPTTTAPNSNTRSNTSTQLRSSQNKGSVTTSTNQSGQPNVAQYQPCPMPIYSAQPNNMGYIYLQSGLVQFCPVPDHSIPYMQHPHVQAQQAQTHVPQAHMVSSLPSQPAQVQVQQAYTPAPQAHSYVVPQAYQQGVCLFQGLIVTPPKFGTQWNTTWGATS